ncbi:MAG TPA: bifunctional UDP-N-acetylmuramoyl-tripeptide:D-alanyl-D-alanine ligase/alanine racemase [Arachidicoccus sp.]|nr:bifunctional UDP-N-acetylmuramoyl-tripeptide:D-alanyl-D-alanine ligase/alanine racemase [Arachidicoccus sp.]
MNYTIQQIKEILGASGLLVVPQALIMHIGTDSRKISFAASSLFFALRTDNRDGVDFIEDVYQQGVRNFVLHAPLSPSSSAYTDANFLVVPDTLLALQQLAAEHRKQFTYPVIGITGSNGKTIVKEWLNWLLSEKFLIVRSPRSFNSQIGVPLSVWEMTDKDELGIFEAGISTTEEMDHLSAVIQPTIGVLTNLGDAHSTGFENKEEKLKEKLKLFRRAGVLFYPADESWIRSLVGKTFELDTERSNNVGAGNAGTGGRSIQVLGIGKFAEADFRVLQVQINRDENNTEISGKHAGRIAQWSIPFTDEAAIQNSITCWAVCTYLGLTESQFLERVRQLPAIDMRLQVLPAIGRCTVINDSYSLDTESLKVALDLLNQQLLSATLILSDIPGIKSGEKSTAYHQMAALIENKHIRRLITIGTQWIKRKSILSVPVLEQYSTTADFIRNFQPGKFKEEAILLKGARHFQFETLLGLLLEKVHQTRLEINLSAIVHNLKVYRSRLQPGTKMMAMVKAFAYGSGLLEMASVLQYHKIDYLAVAYVDEGVALRNGGIHVPIMVMNVDEYGFETIVQHQLEPEIYSFRILEQFVGFLRRQGLTGYPVHIKIDTGMHRLGFEPAEMTRLVLQLQNQPTIYIKSAFSHFTSSEDGADDLFTRQQGKVFLECCGLLSAGLGYDFIRHLANSAAIARFPQFQLDMVRLGVGLYGINTTGENLDLRTVATLKATIAQIKYITPGDTVGYNRKGKADRPITTATIRIGYADGFSRLLGNGSGAVMIRGKMARVIGNVCMDMTMVDITEIPEAREGDDVEIFGEALPVQQMAAASHTSSYEIFTSIGQRVNRVYLED